MVDKITHQLINLLNIVLPGTCALCGRIGSELCFSCQKKLPMPLKEVCFGCLKVSKSSKLCKVCRQKFKPINQVYHLGGFNDPFLNKIIKEFKYNQRKNLAFTLAALMVSGLKQQQFNFNLIVPVPLYKSRQEERGYNQSEVIAIAISNITRISHKNCLERVREGKIQAGLTRVERERNLLGAFRLKKGFTVKDKNILLVDDVLTTGTTLKEAAKILESAGAGSIYAAVIAREF